MTYAFRRVVMEFQVCDEGNVEAHGPDFFFGDLGWELSQEVLKLGPIDYLDVSFGPRFLVRMKQDPFGQDYYSFVSDRVQASDILTPLMRKRQAIALRR